MTKVDSKEDHKDQEMIIEIMIEVKLNNLRIKVNQEENKLNNKEKENLVNLKDLQELSQEIFNSQKNYKQQNNFMLKRIFIQLKI